MSWKHALVTATRTPLAALLISAFLASSVNLVLASAGPARDFQALNRDENSQECAQALRIAE